MSTIQVGRLACPPIVTLRSDSAEEIARIAAFGKDAGCLGFPQFFLGRHTHVLLEFDIRRTHNSATCRSAKAKPGKGGLSFRQGRVLGQFCS